MKKSRSALLRSVIKRKCCDEGPYGAGGGGGGEQVAAKFIRVCAAMHSYQNISSSLSRFPRFFAFFLAAVKFI